MINLYMARERISQMETVWIMMVKLVLKRRNIPKARENISSSFLSFSSRRYMWIVNGMYSTINRQSATAIPVRITLMGFDLMSLWVNTMMLRMLKTVPMMHTTRVR